MCTNLLPGATDASVIRDVSFSAACPKYHIILSLDFYIQKQVLRYTEISQTDNGFLIVGFYFKCFQTITIFWWTLLCNLDGQKHKFNDIINHPLLYCKPRPIVILKISLGIGTPCKKATFLQSCFMQLAKTECTFQFNLIKA